MCSVVLYFSIFITLLIQPASLAKSAQSDELYETDLKTFSVEGKIRLRVQLLNGSFIGSQLSSEQRKTVFDDMVVTLSGNHLHYTALVRQEGQFVFDNVFPGAYFLEVHSRFYIFEAVRVDVSKFNGVIKAKRLVFLKPLQYPLIISPISTTVFFEPERQLDIMSYIFGNKIIWIFGGMTIMMFFASKMSPEVPTQTAEEARQSPERLLGSLLPKQK